MIRDGPDAHQPALGSAGAESPDKCLIVMAVRHTGPLLGRVLEIHSCLHCLHLIPRVGHQVLWVRTSTVENNDLSESPNTAAELGKQRMVWNAGGGIGDESEFLLPIGRPQAIGGGARVQGCPAIFCTHSATQHNSTHKHVLHALGRLAGASRVVVAWVQ